jgi:hypothetical protein
MRHLGGNAACQQFAGEVACEGMRRHLTEAWMEHLCVAWPKFHRWVACEEQMQVAAVTGRHDAAQPMRWLKVAGGHTVVLVARGGDGWTTCRWEFGR